MTNRLAPIALAFLLSFLACSPSPSRQAADRDEIKAFLESYLPLLGLAYASGDLGPLDAYVAQKEIATIAKHLENVSVSGRTLEPTFRSLTIEEVDVWNYANAYVTTREVWDLRLYASGSREQLGEELDHVDRVKYQLKRQEGRWRVLYRAKQE